MRVATLLFVVWTQACGLGGGEEEDGRDKRPPEPVTVVETAVVGTGDVSDRLLTSATIEAAAEAALVPEASGRVVSVRRDVGDRVRRGEVLAVLDNVTLDATADRADAEVGRLEARVAEARRLAERGAVSTRELEDLEYQLTTARSTQREARRGRGTLELTAPFDGVVAARDLRVGEVVGATTVAFRIVDPSELRVRARLPERDAPRVQVGQTARLNAAYEDTATATATVSRVAPVIDPTNGTFEVVLTLDPSQQALRPGQFVSVELEVGRHSGVVVVPKDAVVHDRGQPVVFLVEEAPPEPDTDPAPDTDPSDDGPRFLAKRVEITEGLADAKQVEVTAGLTVGARLVVVGQSNLKDGARVREATSATVAPPAPAAPAPAEGAVTP